jgi:hypothetical protein
VTGRRRREVADQVELGGDLLRRRALTPDEIGVRDELPLLADAETLAERLDQVHPAYVLPRQLLLAQDRAAWLGQQLARQIHDEGVEGIVGDSYTVTEDGEPVKVGEYVRALWEAERDERKHVSDLAVKVARLGLDADAARSSTARTIAVALEHIVGELGFTLADDLVLRAAQRAGLAARAAMGLDDGPAAEQMMGARLSDTERVKVLRAALTRAQRVVRGAGEARTGGRAAARG